MLPTYIRDSGILCKLSKADARVYIAIILRTRWSEGGAAGVSQEQLCSATGLDQRTVRRSINSLKKHRALEIVRRGCGKGVWTIYRVLHEGNIKGGQPRPPLDGCPTTSRARTDAPSLSCKPGHACPQRRTDHARTEGAGVRKGGHQRPLLQRKRYKAAEDAAAVATSQEPGTNGNADTSALLSVLHRHRIDAPTDRLLLDEFPGMTPALIEEAVQDLAATAGAGMRVTRIRERMPELVKRELERAQGRIELSKRFEVIVANLTARHQVFRDEIAATLSAMNGPLRRQLDGEAIGNLAQMLDGSKEAREIVSTWRASAKSDNPPWLVALWLTHNTIESAKQDERKQRAERRAASERTQIARKRAIALSTETKRQEGTAARFKHDWFEHLTHEQLLAYFHQLLDSPFVNEACRAKYAGVENQPSDDELRKTPIRLSIIHHYAPDPPTEGLDGEKARVLKAHLDE